MKRVADYIIDQVVQAGVKHIYMVTGRGSLFLNDAVAASKDISAVCAHHEQAAAFAAVADAQYSESLGVCMVSTGCAMTNALTGVLNAWQDGIPCLFISGQNKVKETSYHTRIPIRTYGQQETNIIPIVQSITKYAVTITNPQATVFEIGKAIYLSTEGRKGPVWVDVPLDIQNSRIDVSSQEAYSPRKNIFQSCNQDITYLMKALENAERPVLLLGSGVRSSGAIALVKDFAEHWEIPITYSPSAADLIDSHHPLCIGSVGVMGCSRAGNFTVQNSDLLIVLGNRLNSMITGNEFEKFARDARIIVVDIDETEHSKEGVPIDHFIKCDLKHFLEQMPKKRIQEPKLGWLRQCQHWKQVFPRFEATFNHPTKVDLYQLASVFSETLPPDSVFICDSGLIELILPSNVEFTPPTRCIHPASQGSMGFALPAIVGAYFSSKKTVVAVIGDGSFMMNLQELQTIRYHKIPAKIFVVNNNAYSIIRKRQNELFRRRTIGTDSENGLSIPDFRQIADCFGLQYESIDNNQNFTKKMSKIFDFDGAVLCEIAGVEDQNYIQMSHTKNSEKKIVQRPLEDQSPFLDRDFFLSEMITKPIDQ